jgi:hypothetical protein
VGVGVAGWSLLAAQGKLHQRWIARGLRPSAVDAFLKEWQALTVFCKAPPVVTIVCPFIHREVLEAVCVTDAWAPANVDFFVKPALCSGLSVGDVEAEEFQSSFLALMVSTCLGKNVACAAHDLQDL